MRLTLIAVALAALTACLPPLPPFDTGADPDTDTSLDTDTDTRPADDRDDDGVTNALDACPDGEVGWSSSAGTDHDGDGCRDVTEDDDDDDDGVDDPVDGCPVGDTGWTSNGATDYDGDGCRDAGEDLDDDEDGVADAADGCNRGSLDWISTDDSDHDGDGCKDLSEDRDDDNDGIDDVDDTCPTGEIEWMSTSDTDWDGDGCRDLGEDLDDDNDGVPDTEDLCPRGLDDWTSIPPTDNDGDGCHDGEEDPDDDNDGLDDPVDACPAGEVIWERNDTTDRDGDGCFDRTEDLDDDNDGVPDIQDACSAGMLDWVSSLSTDPDADGCHDDEDDDDDGDGVDDDDDTCPRGATGWRSDLDTDPDRDGCRNSEDDDDDGDGIEDGPDVCPLGDTGWESDDDNDHDHDGCRDASEDPDDDNDGVFDLQDVCLRGETGWRSTDATDHDGDGCWDTEEDPDDDGDTIYDVDDDCPVGVIGWASNAETDHDGDGCRDEGEDLDDDNDGHPDSSDCGPRDAATYPGAPEQCDGVDNNCDGIGGAPGPVEDFVFVEPGARGDGTVGAPLGSLQAAIDLAVEHSLDILVAEGRLTEAPIHDTGPADEILAISGGHEGCDWSQTGGETVIAAPGGEDTVFTVSRPLALDGLTLQTDPDCFVCYGIKANSSAADVSLVEVFVDANPPRTDQPSSSYGISLAGAARLSMTRSRVETAPATGTSRAILAQTATVEITDSDIITGAGGAGAQGIVLGPGVDATVLRTRVEATASAGNATGIDCTSTTRATLRVVASDVQTHGAGRYDFALIASGLCASEVANSRLLTNGTTLGAAVYYRAQDDTPEQILVNSIVQAGSGAAFQLTRTGSAYAPTIMSHNLVWQSGSPLVILGSDPNLSGWTGFLNCGWGSCVTHEHLLNANPNVNGDDLSPSSPAIEQGTDPTDWIPLGAGADLLGRRRPVDYDGDGDAAWDIGPWELPEGP